MIAVTSRFLSLVLLLVSGALATDLDTENSPDSCGSEDLSCVSLPIINLSESEPLSVEKLRFAATNYGFFYLSGHGITSEEFAEIYSLSRSFFALSEEEKNAVRMNHQQLLNGYIPLDASRLNYATNESTPRDLRESIRMDFSDTEFTNQFPEHPNVAHLEEKLTAFVRKCETMCFQLLGLIAQSLDLEPSYFDDYVASHISTLYFHRYLPVLSNVANHIYGVGPHSDYGIFTLLLVDDESDDSLQILLNRTDIFQVAETQNPHSQWIRVKPKKDMFVVNLGEVLSIWTNDYYMSALHRVIMNSEDKARYSIPFHFDPSLQTVIQCMEAFATNCKYAPMTFQEQLRQKLQRSIFDE